MTRDDWRWALAAIALPLVFCASRLSLNLWGDEAFTLLHFARQPFSGIVTDYSLPNNHILYTLLIRPVFLASREEFVLRLPSFVFALATLLLSFRLALVLIGRAAAVWTTLALGLNVMFLVHAMQVRGYGLSMLLAVALADLAAPRSETEPPRWPKLLGIAICGAAFVYTIPTNAIFLAAFMLWAIAAAWLFGARGPSLAKLFAAWLAAWMLALVAYWPVIDQLRAQSQTSPTGRLGAWTLEIAIAFAHDVWPIWLLSPLAIYSWYRRTRHSSRAERWIVPGLCLAMLLGPWLLCVMTGIRPFARNFTPALPFFALATGWIVNEALTAARLRWFPTWNDVRVALLGATAIAGLLIPAILLYPARLAREREQRRPQDGYFNYYAARFEPWLVAQALRQQVDPAGTYTICYASRDQYDLVYQLSQVGFPTPAVHLANPKSPAGPFFVVLSDFPDYADLERTCGVTRAELAEFRTIAGCGNFRVLIAPTLRNVERNAH